MQLLISYLFLASIYLLASPSRFPSCNETYVNEEYELVSEGRARIAKNNLTLDPDDFMVDNGVLCIIRNSTTEKRTLPCTEWNYEPDDYEILENGTAFTTDNMIYDKGFYETRNESGKVYLKVCIPEEFLKEKISQNTTTEEENEALMPFTCKTWEYDPDEFEILENGTAITKYNETFEKGSYDTRHESGQVFLKTCIPEEVIHGTASFNGSQIETGDSSQYEIVITQVGAILSVLALSVHLFIFITVKSLRNLPSYNLASLSLAFWLAYFFMLVGQIPEVLGVYCVASAALVFYFFLAAFLWMNALSFDIWYTLSYATYKLCSVSAKTKRKLFIWYSVYSWILPLAPVTIALVADNYENFLHDFRPGFGDGDLCFFTTHGSKKAFFVIPILVLVLINCVFFALCTIIIIRNTIATNSEQQSTARSNFLLYVRLGLIMGLTWLIGVIGVFTENEIAWICFVALNTNQGVFIFVLFSCKRKVWNHLKKRFNFDLSMNSSSYNLTSSS